MDAFHAAAYAPADATTVSLAYAPTTGTTTMLPSSSIRTAIVSKPTAVGRSEATEDRASKARLGPRSAAALAYSSAKKERWGCAIGVCQRDGTGRLAETLSATVISIPARQTLAAARGARRKTTHLAAHLGDRFGTAQDCSIELLVSTMHHGALSQSRRTMALAATAWGMPQMALAWRPARRPRCRPLGWLSSSCNTKSILDAAPAR